MLNFTTKKCRLASKWRPFTLKKRKSKGSGDTTIPNQFLPLQGKLMEIICACMVIVEFLILFTVCLYLLMGWLEPCLKPISSLIYVVYCYVVNIFCSEEKSGIGIDIANAVVHLLHCTCIYVHNDLVSHQSNGVTQ